MAELRIRNIDQEDIDALRERARIRRISAGEYLHRLLDLHADLARGVEPEADDYLRAHQLDRIEVV